MAKLKTKKGWSKRMKIRKSGTPTRRKVGMKHNLLSKSKRRKRRLIKPAPISASDLRRIKGF